jgi:hypothetical protein
MPGLKTIFSRDGTPITDFKASAIRSSLLNEIGEAVFYIATSSIKCKREVLEYGNFVLMQHDSLGDWVGVIDTPRPWHHGYVEVHAFEPAYILQYRTTPLNGLLDGTPGIKITQLLAMANGQEDTLIRAGNIFIGGAASQEITDDSVYAHLKKISDNNHYDWVTTPSVDSSGKLSIALDWFEKAGVQTDLELAQGKNILYGDTPLEESGEIINSVLALSDAAELSVIYTDELSRKQIGLRQVRHTFSGITETLTLQVAAKQYVDDHKESDIGTPLTAVNVGATFSNIRLGNTARQKNTDVGFDGDSLGQSMFIRIMGWRFDETAGTCELFTGKA